DLGCHFEALVAAWTRVEAASRFEQDPNKLPTKHRPKAVTEWVGNGRARRGIPPPQVEDAAAYAAQWQQWWDSLQPGWRKRDVDGRWATDGLYSPDGKEWGLLYRWGVNGKLSILASLYFWGCAVVADDGELHTDWEVAVNDVIWMVEGLATFYEMFKGRF
ncbi:hypothetical protein DFH09DRAFT_936506, partial [Mycena vulgaris]